MAKLTQETQVVVLAAALAELLAAATWLAERAEDVPAGAVAALETAEVVLKAVRA